ncbi:hypothetical protein OLN12_19990, partial [Pseudomonas aeruginosa]|uniref:hypothetical protein n=1 Tax=Pseudomonas aeruginosa TaxID=287 RepID=UPI002499171A
QSDNPLRKIFFFTSLAFYQPEIPDTPFILLAFQNAISRNGWLLQSLTSRARYFQLFYRATFFRLTEITFRLPALFDSP